MALPSRLSLALVSVLACGGSTSLQSSPEPSDGLAEDASAPRVVVPGEQPTPGVDAGAVTVPCHLVEDGAPFRGVVFDDPARQFVQNGLLLRGNRLVQYGNVRGIRTGTWQDPPIFAAEYDVSTWPPRPLRGPTEWFHSMHDPADLTELPDGRLALTWWFDNDSPLGAFGVRTRTVDADTWELGPDRFLIESGRTWSRREPAGDAQRTASVYRVQRVSADGQRFEYDTRLGFFTTDGSADGALPLWTGPSEPDVTVARTASELLVAASFGSCDDLESVYCEPNSIVVLRAHGTGLERMAALRLEEPDTQTQTIQLVSDRAGHDWLTWWQASAPPTVSGRPLLAVPLTEHGAIAGPTERWSVETGRRSAQRQPATIGPLGMVYVVSHTVTDGDGGERRELQLLHRQLEGNEPLEELTLALRAGGAIEAVQQTTPRALLLGYSISGDPVAGTFGELRRFVCREDRIEGPGD